MNRKITGMRLFVTIVDRNMGNRVVKLFEEVGSHYHQIIYGKGTAPKEIYDYLGFGVIEKEVVLSLAPTDLVPIMIDVLRTELHFDQPGHGVACTIPLDSVAGKSVLDEILRENKLTEDSIMNNIKEEK